MPLTDLACRNARCPEGVPYVRLADGGGLYLEVTAAGGKLWRWNVVTKHFHSNAFRSHPIRMPTRTFRIRSSGDPKVRRLPRSFYSARL
jgi:hypothetical protein